MADQVWAEEPPPISVTRRRGRFDWEQIASDLRARPGEWLLIAKDAGIGIPSAVKRDKIVALRDPEWAFACSTRNNDRDTGTCELWMSATKREDT